MNKNILFVVVLFTLTTSCTTTTRTVGTKSSCSAYVIPSGACGGDKASPEVRITKAGSQYVFTPGKICAEPGKTIVFKLLPPPQNLLGTAAILPKDPTHSWLSGTNWEDKDEIKILVPEWVTEGPHDYAFVTSTGACVDPRVEVTY